MAFGRTTAGALAALALVLAGPASAGLVSQGAVRMGADALWSQGYRGAGQTVAVLDMGFGGLDRSIELGELPSRAALTIASFDATYGLDGRSEIGGLTQHGVRMAELVHDVAPQARLLLANYHTQAEFRQAVDWALANGANVVSHSNSFLTPPFDGTGDAARTVDRAAAAGVLWVNSVGNYAQRHWSGRADAAPAVIPIAPRPGEYLMLSLAWRDPAVRAVVAVERQDPAGWTEVQRSVPEGALGAGTERLLVEGGAWRLVVRQEAGPPATLRLFSQTVQFGDLAVADGSVPNPADAAGALAVGAVRWTDTALAPYSSRGPTDAGRLKPDLVAPTYVNSNPEWPGTAGTSAATAHVAGGAALVREMRLATGLPVDPAALRAALLDGAMDLGDPGPDPSFGVGQIRLDTARPTLRMWLSAGPRRALRVRATDRGTLRELRIALDGRVLRTARRPYARLALPALRPGRHRLRIEAEDMAGNVAVRTRALRGGR
jgi:hypothetical protein